MNNNHKFQKRIAKEIKALKKQSFLVAWGQDKSEFNMIVKIKGPAKTAFKDFDYYMRISVNTESYPLEPPSLTFLSDIYHPNIADSDICLDILDEKWSPILSIETVIHSMESLLNCPNPKDPLDDDAASDYMKKGRKTFIKINRELKESQKEKGDEYWIKDLGCKNEMESEENKKDKLN